MNDSISQKEVLLKMMTDIYNQLEELESILEESFNQQRDSWKMEGLTKIDEAEHRMTNFEKKIDKVHFNHFEERTEFPLKLRIQPL